MNWKFIWNENVGSDSFLCGSCEDRFIVKIEPEDAWYCLIGHEVMEIDFGINGF